MINYLYKEHLQWINQIQLFRKELADIKCEVSKIPGTAPFAGELSAETIIESVININKELDCTDRLIIQRLNKDRVIRFGRYNKLDEIIAGKEKCLYERIKTHFTQVLDLQQKVARFLTVYHLSEYNETNNEQWKSDRRASKGIQRSVPLFENRIL